MPERRRTSGDDQMEHGFDITQTTEAAMRPATVNSQVAAALLMRACSFPSAAERSQGIAALKSLITQLQADTVEHLKCTSCGLADGTCKAPKNISRKLHDSPPCRLATRLAAAEAEQQVIDRVPQHLVRVRLCDEDVEQPPESDIDLLSKSVDEMRHTRISKGTGSIIKP